MGASTLWSVEIRAPGGPVRNDVGDFYVVHPDGVPGSLYLRIPVLLIIHSWQATWLGWLLAHPALATCP